MESSSSEEGDGQQGFMERRNLRSQYLAFKNQICGKGEEVGKADSIKFSSIIGEVENLHQHVQRPREQVADAEALLDIATSLATSVKSQVTGGPTPSKFITALLSKYSDTNSPNANSISWRNLGRDVSHIFMSSSGCSTMNGPMDTEIKSRRNAVQRRRSRAAETSRPEQVDESEGDGTKKTDTDNNMLALFSILRQNKVARLERLILNRVSFSQTVENLFALSFLVKDGRAEITVDSNGHHFVRPRNAPAAASIASGEVNYSHFVFRFDIKDWKLMKEMVEDGEELMPHRCNSREGATSSSGTSRMDSRSGGPCAGGNTPIKTLTRNRGLIMRGEESVAGSPSNKDSNEERFRHKFR